ncbi:intradiol ring-cleavage dioxygenase [Pontibacter mucosus]|nr:intradiol ring-cleavage dioxygenase [Pontibacter mucosus]
MYIGIPESINATDTSAAWKEPGQKLLISGTVYMPDGITPASGVILYYWQTNSEGVYKTSDELDQKIEPHGHIRGWVKSGEEGEFNIYTTRPGAYPGRKDPQHIHILVKEPNLPNEYYIDDILFEGDPRLTSDWRRNLENRGGSGIVQTKLENGVQVAERNIILGLNIPDYPTSE